jgi:hypothetical protein
VDLSTQDPVARRPIDCAREEVNAHAGASRSTASGLEQLPKFFDAQSSVFHNSTHGEGIHRVVAWERDEARAIGHYHVLALPQNPKTRLLQCSDGPEMI